MRLVLTNKKQILAIYLFLAVITVVAFRQVTRCDFIALDDDFYVTENVHIQNGITGEAVRWAFTTVGYAGYWHPLTWLSHMLDVQLFGLNPHWHHLTNLLFHIANTLLLFYVINRMTKAPWKSAFVAALFAVHPLHVESVAWVAERKDVLSTFFFMLTLAAYLSYVECPRLKNYLAALALFVLGLMAKPMLVTLPFVLLLLDFWPLRRFEHTKRPAGPEVLSPQSLVFIPLLLEKIPFFVLAALSCIVTFIAQQKGGAVRSVEAFSLGARIANAFVSYVIYIAKMIWPTGLAVFYPHPGQWPFWQAAGAALLLGAVTVTLILAARRFPYLATGWLWFAGTLVPVIGIVQAGDQAMADRFTYIPLIGLFIMVAWGIPELLQKWQLAHPPRKEALFASSALIILCFLIVTSTQVGYWRNSIAMFDYTLKVTDRNDTIHLNRGAVYQGLGKQWQAIEDYSRAIEINPKCAAAYSNRGAAYEDLGNHRQAIENCGKAIEIDPKFAEAYYNRGIAYDNLGNHRQEIEDMTTAARLDNEYAKKFLIRRGVSW